MYLFSHSISRDKYMRILEALSVCWRGIMEALSVCWRGIMEAHPILESGSQWWVGDRCFIRILHLFRPYAGFDLHLVSSLIITKSAFWNTNLPLFLPCEAAMIFSILLKGRLPLDSLMWHYNSKRLFSVKSAYNVVVSLCDLASPSNQSTEAISTWNKT